VKLDADSGPFMSLGFNIAQSSNAPQANGDGDVYPMLANNGVVRFRLDTLLADDSGIVDYWELNNRYDAVAEVELRDADYDPAYPFAHIYVAEGVIPTSQGPGGNEPPEGWNEIYVVAVGPGGAVFTSVRINKKSDFDPDTAL